MVVLTGEVSLAAQPGKKALSSACRLNSEGGSAEHVIFLASDRAFPTRLNANVPSDLQQMPNLLNFIRGNRHAVDESSPGPSLRTQLH